MRSGSINTQSAAALPASSLLEESVPGGGGGRGSEEAEAGELGRDEGLIIAVDHAGLPSCCRIHCVPKSIEQAGL